MPAPQNQQMYRNKSVRHLGLYGYVWEWDGEDAQGNKWRRFDPKMCLFYLDAGVDFTL